MHSRFLLIAVVMFFLGQLVTASLLGQTVAPVRFRLDDQSKSEAEPEATGPKCKHCGQPATCKVCRAVAEKKKVSDTVFSCECEDFCVPGRSQVTCEEAVDDDGCVTSKIQWIPTAGQMRQRKKLVKSTESREETQWKLVVEHVCANCACYGPPAASDKKSSESGEKPAQPQPAGEKTSQSSTEKNALRLPLFRR